MKKRELIKELDRIEDELQNADDNDDIDIIFETPNNSDDETPTRSITFEKVTIAFFTILFFIVFTAYFTVKGYEPNEGFFTTLLRAEGWAVVAGFAALSLLFIGFLPMVILYASSIFLVYVMKRVTGDDKKFTSDETMTLQKFIIYLFTFIWFLLVTYLVYLDKPDSVTITNSIPDYYLTLFKSFGFLIAGVVLSLLFSKLVIFIFSRFSKTPERYLHPAVTKQKVLIYVITSATFFTATILLYVANFTSTTTSKEIGDILLSVVKISVYAVALSAVSFITSKLLLIVVKKAGKPIEQNYVMHIPIFAFTAFMVFMTAVIKPNEILFINYLLTSFIISSLALLLLFISSAVYMYFKQAPTRRSA